MYLKGVLVLVVALIAHLHIINADPCNTGRSCCTCCTTSCGPTPRCTTQPECGYALATSPTCAGVGGKSTCCTNLPVVTGCGQGYYGPQYCGYGNVYGYSSGGGYGCGYGSDYGCGYGSGYGSGYGGGYGSGYGNSYGSYGLGYAGGYGY